MTRRVLHDFAQSCERTPKKGKKIATSFSLREGVSRVKQQFWQIKLPSFCLAMWKLLAQEGYYPRTLWGDTTPNRGGWWGGCPFRWNRKVKSPEKARRASQSLSLLISSFPPKPQWRRRVHLLTLPTALPLRSRLPARAPPAQKRGRKKRKENKATLFKKEKKN